MSQFQHEIFKTLKTKKPWVTNPGPLSVRLAGGIRTRDDAVVNDVLYPLSYSETQAQGKLVTNSDVEEFLLLWITEFR